MIILTITTNFFKRRNFLDKLCLVKLKGLVWSFFFSIKRNGWKERGDMVQYVLYFNVPLRKINP